MKPVATERTDAVARIIGRLAAQWKAGEIDSAQNFAIQADQAFYGLRELEKQLAALRRQLEKSQKELGEAKTEAADYFRRYSAELDVVRNLQAEADRLRGALREYHLATVGVINANNSVNLEDIDNAVRHLRDVAENAAPLAHPNTTEKKG
jgi:DNA repair ATPase RecN